MTNEIRIYSDVETISQVCRKILPMPRNSVLFGMGEDDLPILLDVSRSSSSNTLIWEDSLGQGSGVIKTAIEFVLRYKEDATEFVVISNNIKEWESTRENTGKECVAITPFWDIVSDKLIDALAEWCERGRHSKHGIVLFVDGLENTGKMWSKVKDNLRFVLENGRKHGIYVVATASAKNKEDVEEWIEMFQAQAFGQKSVRWFEMDKNHGEVLFFAPITTI